VRALAELKPRVIAAGHGEPIVGEHLATDLENFANNFTPPEHGRYVVAPAEANEHGVIYEPPPPPDHLPKIGAAVVAGMFLFAGIFFSRRGKKAIPAADVE
jgi:hypothetical protein